jgi:hypothetical protein
MDLNGYSEPAAKDRDLLDIRLICNGSEINVRGGGDAD